MRAILCLLLAVLIACVCGNKIQPDGTSEYMVPDTVNEKPTLASRRAACLEICYERFNEREMYAKCRAMYQSDLNYNTGLYILCIRDYNLDLKMCRLSCVLSQIEA